ncbi:hypothetical protein ACWJKU_17420 [Methylocaldum sp. MU1018]
MPPMDASSPPTIDIEALGFDRGAHLLVKHALAGLPVGATLRVLSEAPEFRAHAAAWCRSQGHGASFDEDGSALIVRGGYQTGRWRGAERSGRSDPRSPDAVAEHAKAGWGLAARGSTVEAGGPEWGFALDRKHEIWADEAADLYRQALASQWDPDTAVDWSAPFELPDEVEDAVVQVMTYLIENENAALLVPARFLGRIHPHYREIVQLLAIQVADEARHVEVFTQRARLKGREPALSTAGGQLSLKTLVDEPDFSVAAFLLSVLGEGTFVNLLNFLHVHAPDPVTRRIARLAARDEARHVAFGMGHLFRRLNSEPELRARLANAVELRHDTLSAGAAGLNEEVFDALVLLAAGEWSPAAIAAGFERVQALKSEMAEGRRLRLCRLGFDEVEAERLASLHTRNFM